MLRLRHFVLPLFLLTSAPLLDTVNAQGPRDHFRQLDDVWPTPDSVRRASGAPGDDYWQQKVDYEINVRIDEDARILHGEETITYHNRSPDTLEYLWLQLDQNRYERNSDEWLTKPSPNMEDLSYGDLRSFLYRESFDGGHDIDAVTDVNNKPLRHRIIRTMMRIELPEPLAPQQSFDFKVRWHFNIVNAVPTRVRGGYEYFAKDRNHIFNIAQWYPRLCAYTDYGGWQNRQSMGAEFALEFGDFRVRITVPEDHVVAATGELQNADAVLTQVQRQRLKRAQEAAAPVQIVTLEEAAENETTKSSGLKTWEFSARNVRDFAFASSRKFLWDAQGFDLNGRRVLAMSFWPKEGEPLWSKFSTASVIHAVKSYSKFTFDYPYPVIISVNGPIRGMEYPMITFQNPRPEADGTYSAATRNGLISVIIHEVGHNWFPMVVNSDERQWRWMDEGLNSFLQLLAEQEWDDNYPSRILNPERRRKLDAYLVRKNKRPIMSAADNLIDGGHTAYSKPTLALTILRETILGREQFDFAFQRYARRWMFRRPTPFDFFRTMEESTGMDLDWFWRGWFYSTEHVDLSIKNVTKYSLQHPDPTRKNQQRRTQQESKPQSLIAERNSNLPKRIHAQPDVTDFYSTFDEFSTLPDDRRKYEQQLKALKPFERDLLNNTSGEFYHVEFENIGGVVMPLILQIQFTDGSQKTIRMPAEVWRLSDRSVSKLIRTNKPILSMTLDPRNETSDVERTNNTFPRQAAIRTFELKKTEKKRNPMQQMANPNPR